MLAKMNKENCRNALIYKIYVCWLKIRGVNTCSTQGHDAGWMFIGRCFKPVNPAIVIPLDQVWFIIPMHWHGHGICNQHAPDGFLLSRFKVTASKEGILVGYVQCIIHKFVRHC